MKITLELRPAEDGDDLTCLFCRLPIFGWSGERARGAPPCEYTVTYRTRDATLTSGVHKVCAERSGATP